MRDDGGPRSGTVQRGSSHMGLPLPRAQVRRPRRTVRGLWRAHLRPVGLEALLRSLVPSPAARTPPHKGTCPQTSTGSVGSSSRPCDSHWWRQRCVVYVDTPRSRVGKYRDIFENIENIEYFRYFRYKYQAFAHTLLKLYELYYQIIVCVCALHIRWSTLVIHTALLWIGAIWQKLSNTEKMLRTQVISQQNMWTENQNIHNVPH